jgi:hypothetical protein
MKTSFVHQEFSIADNMFLSYTNKMNLTVNEMLTGQWIKIYYMLNSCNCEQIPEETENPLPG